MKKLIAQDGHSLRSEVSLSILNTLPLIRSESGTIYGFDNIDEETDTDSVLLAEQFTRICKKIRPLDRHTLSKEEETTIIQFLDLNPQDYPKMDIPDLRQFFIALRKALKYRAGVEMSNCFNHCQELVQENQALREILKTAYLNQATLHTHEDDTDTFFETNPIKIKIKLQEQKLNANTTQIEHYGINAQTYAELGLLIQDLDSAHNAPSTKNITYLKLKYLDTPPNLKIRQNSKSKHIMHSSPKPVRKAMAQADTDHKKLTVRLHDLIHHLEHKKDRANRLESLRELYADLRLLETPQATNIQKKQLENLYKLKEKYQNKIAKEEKNSQKINHYTHLIDIELELIHAASGEEIDSIKQDLKHHIQDRHALYLEQIHKSKNALSFENLDQQNCDELAYILELMQAKALIHFQEIHFIGETKDKSPIKADPLMQFRSKVLTFFEEAFIFKSTKAKIELQTETNTDTEDTLEKLTTTSERTRRVSKMIQLCEALEKKGLYTISILLRTILSKYENLFAQTFKGISASEKKSLRYQKTVLEQGLSSYAGYKNKVSYAALLYPHRPTVTLLDSILKTNIILSSQNEHDSIVGICHHMKLFRSEFQHALQAKEIYQLLDVQSLEASMLEKIFEETDKNPYEISQSALPNNPTLRSLSKLLRPTGKAEIQ